MIWILWGALLVAQNFTFTLVSRARNSASLTRHIRASLGSNGVWFASQLILVNTIFDTIKGQNGVKLAVLAGLYYCILTVCGSVLAHWWAMRTEHGSSAVGASKKYAQIPQEEWNNVKRSVELLSSTKA